MRGCPPFTAPAVGVAVLGPLQRELARARICAICSLSAVVLWTLSTAAAAMRLAAMVSLSMASRCLLASLPGMTPGHGA
eukprot:3268231-Heterocapsa_arctica.AAC.1